MGDDHTVEKAYMMAAKKHGEETCNGHRTDKNHKEFDSVCISPLYRFKKKYFLMEKVQCGWGF